MKAVKCHACKTDLETRAKAKYHLLYNCKNALNFKKRELAPRYRKRRYTDAFSPPSTSEGLGFDAALVADYDIYDDQELQTFHDPDLEGDDVPVEQHISTVGSEPEPEPAQLDDEGQNQQTLASGRKRRSENSRCLPRRYMQLDEQIPRAKPRKEKLQEINRDSERAETAAFTEVAQAAEITRRLLATKTSRAGLTCIYAEYVRNGDDGDIQQNNEPATGIVADSLLGNPYHPFPNKSTFEWTKMLWLGQRQLTWRKFEEMTNIIQQDDFDCSDINLPDIKRICRDTGTDDDSTWVETDLKIRISTGHLRKGAAQITEYNVDTFHYRPLLSIAVDYFKSAAANRMSFEPMELRYQPPNCDINIGVYGELTWSKEFRKKHAEIQSLPRVPGDKLPRAVAAFMFSSDGMQVTHFSSQKLWPIYVMFGNESQLDRSSPECDSLMLAGFIPHV